MEALSKIVAGATAAGVSMAAMNADKLPAPIITAIAGLITAAGAALIRWIERKVLKIEKNNLEAENANLRMQIERMKQQA